MSKKLLRVFEHDPVLFDEVVLTIPKGERFAFPLNYRERVNRFHTASKGRYYDLINNGIKFRQYVGVIQIKDLTIEILPKVDRNNGQRESKSHWHNILIEMLQECKLLKPRAEQKANLQLRQHSILDLYLSVFVGELEFLLRAGLVKKYRKVEGNQLALKGAILFGKQLQVNYSHAERFYTRHSTYDHYHQLHQVLYQALQVCDQLITTGLLKDRINRLSREWPIAKQVQINPEIFLRLSADRKAIPYQEALLIAKMLLLNFHPEIQGGNEHVLALMFDMNRLWEEYVYQMLKGAEYDFGFKVHSQSGVDFWQAASADHAKSVIPDLLLEYNNGLKRTIIDTKWKCPSDAMPDDNDLKQMLAYKMYYHADEAILLYPNRSQTFLSKGNFENQVHWTATHEDRRALKADLKTGCHMGFLNLLTESDHLVSKGEFNEELKQLL